MTTATNLSLSTTPIISTISQLPTTGKKALTFHAISSQASSVSTIAPTQPPIEQKIVFPTSNNSHMSIDLGDIFAHASYFSFKDGQLSLKLDSGRIPHWEELSEGQTSRHIFDTLNSFTMESDGTACYWKLNQEDLKKFAQSYHDHSMNQQEPFYYAQVVPVAPQDCMGFFKDIARTKSWSDLEFFLSEKALTVTCGQKDWDTLFANVPFIACKSADQKSWVVKKENLRTFFEQVKALTAGSEKPLPDLFASYLKTIDQNQVEQIQIFYGPENLFVFLSSQKPHLHLLKDLAANGIGELITGVSFSFLTHQCIRIEKNKMSMFFDRLQVPQEIRAHVEAQSKIKILGV